jgi:tRNA-splicing ligase RtcB (3'-phosphate/5'-hydroxy nucleic acid ligase)
MISELKGIRVPVKLWTPLAKAESQALDQLKNISALPWVFHHVACMPDVHYGKGATVGAVIAMKGAVSPAAVGCDIGCGMAAMETNLTAEDLPESLHALRLDVEAAIPVGFNQHEESVYAPGLADLWQDFDKLDPYVSKLFAKAKMQIGTLGGGNHFLELCLDQTNKVWVMLHSGSRNIGKCLAEIHISRAKELAHNHTSDVPDRDLSVFLAGTPEMQAYRHDLFWAQRYAAANRAAMLNLYAAVLQRHFPQMQAGQVIACHHNYVSEESHFGTECIVTRKGAISARLGEMGIIPGSMGTKSYIVRGLGNPESFQSASHGAGRRMSRGAAKRAFTVQDLETQTAGVECRKDQGVLDEIPGAYKDIGEVMANQADLVEIVHELKQVMCIKG